MYKPSCQEITDSYFMQIMKSRLSKGIAEITLISECLGNICSRQLNISNEDFLYYTKQINDLIANIKRIKEFCYADIFDLDSCQNKMANFVMLSYPKLHKKISHARQKMISNQGIINVFINILSMLFPKHLALDGWDDAEQSPGDRTQPGTDIFFEIRKTLILFHYQQMKNAYDRSKKRDMLK